MKVIKYIRRFFEDNKHNPSMTRLMMFVVVVSACVYPFTITELTTFNVTLVLGMLTIAFGGKVVQKKLSEKNEA